MGLCDPKISERSVRNIRHIRPDIDIMSGMSDYPTPLLLPIRLVADAGASIRKLRKSRRLSVVELAERMGKSRDTVHRLERGEDVSLSTFLSALAALGHAVTPTRVGLPTLEEMTEKGKGSGFHEAMVGSGMFFGPVLAGWVGIHDSLRAPYFFCAAVLAALIVLQMALVASRRRQPSAS